MFAGQTAPGAGVFIAGELPRRCRDIFDLSRFEYLSNKEIAARLGISEKTVKACRPNRGRNTISCSPSLPVKPF
ncbi:sigma factor-like helix-turn-helix DNA-binding protein [Chitinophaga rhizosphaerae]|uniref:sigma factor-like helix-turn-helix DNA-binding protein n=1 Tax=Chitinophaga rhizosphaerae TaxID=1864947 RepID=UPI000F8115DD|nr:sigma factor-like helix-turn-helix DNA-binding protein [Chitinophaga rhizosphaerae]